MELGVVAAVLGAAFLHAFWNFMIRRADDKALRDGVGDDRACAAGYFGFAVDGVAATGRCLMY
jgi:hypothetical protein